MDRSYAIALELAERRLLKLGWRFGAEDIGKVAAEIINAMNSNINKSNPKDTSSHEE